MKASDYTDIGRYFKDSRKSLKISVVEAAHAMHIRVHYVEALENGNLDLLPGKAYIRGYIKNYALFLGISPKEALEAYDGLSVATKPQYYIPEPTISDKLPLRTLMIVILALAVLSGGYFMLSVTTKHMAGPSVAEVPGQLALAAESIKNTRNAQWVDCMNADVNECFNAKFADEFLAQIEFSYRQAFHYLTNL